MRHTTLQTLHHFVIIFSDYASIFASHLAYIFAFISFFLIRPLLLLLYTTNNFYYYCSNLLELIHTSA